MAINRHTEYTTPTNRYSPPDANSVQGAFKNRTAPDSNDGSYIEEKMFNDISAPLERAMSLFGTVLDETADTASSSQKFEALQGIQTAWSTYAESGAVNAYVITNNVSPVTKLFDGMRVIFTATNDSTGPSTLNVSDLVPAETEKPIKLFDGAALVADDILTTIENECVYDLGNDCWVMVRGSGAFKLMASESSGGGGGVLFVNRIDTNSSGSLLIPDGITKVRVQLSAPGGGGCSSSSDGGSGGNSTFDSVLNTQVKANGGSGGKRGGGSGVSHSSGSGGIILVGRGGSAGSNGHVLNSSTSSPVTGGNGGLVYNELDVTPGETVTWAIGARGQGAESGNSSYWGRDSAEGLLILEY